jgi:hypothetical protein
MVLTVVRWLQWRRSVGSRPEPQARGVRSLLFSSHRRLHVALLYLYYIRPGDRYQVLVFMAISFSYNTLHGDLYQVPVPRTHWATTGYRCSHGDLLYLQYIHPGDRYQVLVFTAISFTLSRMSPWGSGCTICTYHIVIPAIPQAPSVRGDERVARGAALETFCLGARIRVDTFLSRPLTRE